MFALPLFYFSSTIAVVDDDASFRCALTEMINDSYRLKIFSDASKCLAFFEQYTASSSTTSFLHGCLDHDYYETVNHAPVDFSVPALAKLADDPDRSNEISVMIIDYCMPGMNGIELSRKLKNIPCKKILLTGKADHHDAIAAFNDNTIDRFIQKGSPTLALDIQNNIKSLSQLYFRERTVNLLAHLEADRPSALSDPIFIHFFQDWCLQHSIQEYVLIDKHGSFMMKDVNGHKNYLIVHTDHTLNEFIKVNDDTENVGNFLRAIEERKQIPFFGVGREVWQFQEQSWSRYFYVSNVLKGRETYYWATIEDCQSENDTKHLWVYQHEEEG